MFLVVGLTWYCWFWVYVGLVEVVCLCCFLVCTGGLRCVCVLLFSISICFLIAMLFCVLGCVLIVLYWCLLLNGCGYLLTVISVLLCICG